MNAGRPYPEYERAVSFASNAPRTDVRSGQTDVLRTVRSARFAQAHCHHASGISESRLV